MEAKKLPISSDCELRGIHVQQLNVMLKLIRIFSVVWFRWTYAKST